MRDETMFTLKFKELKLARINLYNMISISIFFVSELLEVADIYLFFKLLLF